MSEKKSVEVIESNSTMSETPKKKFALPTTFSIKKGTVVKIVVGIVIALILVPVFDWVIQTSITSQYVAFYKDTDVSRSAYIKELERQYGDQVVNEMLAKAAIAQAAKDRDLKISDEDVNKAIEADKASAGITTDADYEKALATNGITKEAHRAYVKVTVTLDKLLEGTVTEPTEKEVSDYYAQNKTTLYDNKKLEEVKTQIIEDLKQASLTTLRQDWISKSLTGYNASNTLVSETSRNYKFLKSIDLVKRLFSKDPTK